MLTIDRQIKKGPTVIEMKSATNMRERDRALEKLGGSIQAYITRLKKLRADIQVETRLKVIAQKVAEYDKVNNEYNQLQKELAQIDDNSQLCHRIKMMNKEFIESYDPAQLKKKLDYMKAQRTRHLQQQDNANSMSWIDDKQQLSGQLLYSDKYAVRRKIMEQEKAELMEIERLIGQVKDIADKTAIMINSQGEKIELSLSKMQKANVYLREGKQNLMQANQYQQDTNKKFMTFCCLTVVIISIILLIMYSSHKKTDESTN